MLLIRMNQPRRSYIECFYISIATERCWRKKDMKLIIDFMQSCIRKNGEVMEREREANIVQRYGFKVNKNEIEIPKKWK